MTKRIALILCFALTGLTGCDTERLNKLEKENQEMKAKVEKNNVERDFDLQAKCSKDARAWFNENWSRDKDTILLDFTNHYNAVVEFFPNLIESLAGWRLMQPSHPTVAKACAGRMSDDQEIPSVIQDLSDIALNMAIAVIRGRQQVA